jgi:hypothetical protein
MRLMYGWCLQVESAAVVKAKLNGEGGMISNTDLEFIHYNINLFSKADLLRLPYVYYRSKENSQIIKSELLVLAKESLIVVFSVVAGLGGGESMLKQALVSSNLLIRGGHVCGQRLKGGEGLCDKMRDKGCTTCKFHHSFDWNNMIVGP